MRAGAEPIRILGLDPGLRATGWGMVTMTGTKLSHIAHGTVLPPEQAPFHRRLLFIFEAITEVVREFNPEEAAVEETFVNTNAASTLKLGHARAAGMVAVARSGIPVAEYAARLIKKSVVGTGAADKSQVAFMVRRLLPTAGSMSADAADALAVAIAHAHARTAPSARLS